MKQTASTPREAPRRGLRSRGPVLLLSLIALLPFLDAATAAGPRLPSLSVAAPATVVEGDEGTTKATFMVTLSAASRKVVRVSFRTDGFLATEGMDFRAASGTLVFQRGQRSKQVVVQIMGDRVPEDSEDVYLILSKPRNARLRIARAAVQIAANDLPAAFSVVADLKAGAGPATGRAAITLDARKGEATFTVEVRSSPRDPREVHIHSWNNVLGGVYPFLTPVPPRDGVATGTSQVSRRTILLIDANLPDFRVEVHVGPDSNSPGDLSGDLRRAP